MKKFVVILLGLVATVAAGAVFVLPLTMEPIEGASFPPLWPRPSVWPLVRASAASPALPRTKRRPPPSATGRPEFTHSRLLLITPSHQGVPRIVSRGTP